MMLRVEMLQLCEHAFLDSRFQPSLIGITTHLFAKTFPHHRAMVTVATVFSLDPDDKPKLVFELGLGKEHRPLRQVPIDFEIKGPPLPSHPARPHFFFPIHLARVFFPTPGEYTAKWSINDTTIASTILRVYQVTSDASGRPSIQGSPDSQTK